MFNQYKIDPENPEKTEINKICNKENVNTINPIKRRLNYKY